jgi:hypothetical protein
VQRKSLYGVEFPVCLIIMMGLLFTSCNREKVKTQNLQKQVDSLKTKLSETYKPGFGEFMSYIQAHHAKLWFAGQNQNWKLADFEIHEIMESFEDIQKYETERKESKMVGMIKPALDSVNTAIERKNSKLFKKSFTLLTNTCNSCHHAVNFEFNVIKIPDVQTFGNQDFKSH